MDIEAALTWLTKGNISAREEAHLCYLQDRNPFGEWQGQFSHFKERFKTVDHLATQCNRRLGHDYTRRHKECVKSIHLFLYNKKVIKRLRSYSVSDISLNAEVEI